MKTLFDDISNVLIRNVKIIKWIYVNCFFIEIQL